MLELQNSAGTLEVLGHSALSEAAGAHPLFNGVRGLVLTGFVAEPTVRESGGRTTIDAQGLKAEFTNAQVQRRENQITIELLAPAAR